MNDTLYHHGIKGQKWGVKNGPPYPIQKYRLSKGTNLTRYSATDERNLRTGTYASYTPHDIKWYKDDFVNGKLGVKNPGEQFYKIKINTINDAVIKKGHAVVMDILAKSEDVELSTAIKKLKKVGFYSPNLDMNERFKIIDRSKELYPVREKAAKKINSFINEHGNELFSEYLKEGYDAIIDPEDYTYNYEAPLILLNKDKFEIKGARRLKNTKYKKQ